MYQPKTRCRKGRTVRYSE